MDIYFVMILWTVLGILAGIPFFSNNATWSKKQTVFAFFMCGPFAWIYGCIVLGVILMGKFWTALK